MYTVIPVYKYNCVPELKALSFRLYIMRSAAKGSVKRSSKFYFQALASFSLMVNSRDTARTSIKRGVLQVPPLAAHPTPAQWSKK